MSKQKPTEYIIINGTTVQRITTTHPGGADFVTAQYPGSTVIQSDGAALSTIATAPDGYRIDDATDCFIEMDYYEKVQAGLMTVDELRSLRYKQLKQLYARIEIEGIDGGVYSNALDKIIDCKLTSINTACQIVQAIAIDETLAPPIYKCYDNSIVTCSPDQWREVYLELYSAGLKLWSDTNNIKLALTAAKTAEEIENAFLSTANIGKSENVIL